MLIAAGRRVWATHLGACMKGFFVAAVGRVILKRLDDNACMDAWR